MQCAREWTAMIKLTKLNNHPLFVNSDLIAHIDATPDTVVSLTSGQKFLVAETPEDVVEKIIEFRKLILEKDLTSPPAEGLPAALPDQAHGRTS
jgi:flagellar protein FlbD